IVIAAEVPYLEEGVGFWQAQKLAKKQQFNKMGNFLKRSGLGAALPLKTEEELYGVLFLSHKVSKKIFTKDEIKFIEVLRGKLSLALHGVLLYKGALEGVS
ncbi:MAG: GAF domain-containing protein, partial [Parcubacteria group bacterium]